MYPSIEIGSIRRWPAGNERGSMLAEVAEPCGGKNQKCDERLVDCTRCAGTLRTGCKRQRARRHAQEKFELAGNNAQLQVAHITGPLPDRKRTLRLHRKNKTLMGRGGGGVKIDASELKCTCSLLLMGLSSRMTMLSRGRGLSLERSLILCSPSFTIVHWSLTKR